MDGLGTSLRYLYEKFLLRDMLSFVIPGGIVVLAALILVWPWTILEQQFKSLFVFALSIPWLLYIPLFGLFYLIGFAVQCFGELFGLLRIHRNAKSNWRKRFGVFSCSWADENNDIIWWEEAYKEVVSFHKLAQKATKRQQEWIHLQEERLIILKQMCGNGAIAAVIAAILLSLRIATNLFFVSPTDQIHNRNVALWMFAIVGLIALILTLALFWGYRVHELRLDTRRKEIRRQLFDGS